MGTTVVIQLPGRSVDGLRTRVTGKTVDDQGVRLYRLEQQLEGEALMLPMGSLKAVPSDVVLAAKGDVIQATVAQLRQVLGQACPFVGPGRWTVRRDEVSPKAWAQLCRLVGEA